MTCTTRRFQFRSVHSLHEGEHREQKHGHQYFFEVSFANGADEVVRPVIDQLIRERLDGHDLSGVVEPATCEVLIEWLHSELSQTAAGPHLLGLAVQETRKNRFVSAATAGHLL